MLRIAQMIASIYMVLALAVVALTVVIGPLPGGEDAPVASFLSLLPGRGPVVISIAYGTEKEEWLKAAVERFKTTNPRVGGQSIEIQLESTGSREIVNEVIQGNLKPTVISPASSIQLELLRNEWEARTNSDIFFTGEDAPQDLVITPLVIVAWEERAQVLSFHDSQQLWQHIHDVLAEPQGWGAFGHPEWGLAKYGQTNPETSNSGIQALLLQAYAYHNKSRGLTNQDILDPEFQQWLDEIQSAVYNREFPPSTGTLMDDVVRFGPSKYDFVVVYENLAIENIEKARGRGGDLKVYYPPANILSNHPYAILNAAWVTSDQRTAAAQFREFLLSDEIQTSALVDYGFRPASTAVAFNVANNPFERFASFGIQQDIAQSVELPEASVLNELITLWSRKSYAR